jgi:carbonic anhydrase/acetyltransferase-like protein (isoleucine patch superfamily)
MLYSISTRKPDIDPTCFVADDAVLIGSIRIEADCSIWFGTILRGDNDLITILQGTNIQDGVVVHTDEGIPMTVGKQVTVGHKAVLHGCQIGDNALIGINAVLLNKAKIGNNCLIGAGALVPEGKEIPDNSVVFGTPGRVVREVTQQERDRIKSSALHYVDKASLYRNELRKLCP